MQTFDVVNRYKIHEIENAVNMVKRDIFNRYDFKGTSTNISLNKKNATIKIESNSEMQLGSVRDMLEKRAVERKVSIKIFKIHDVEKGSGESVRQNIDLQEGISKDNAKRINKLIKDYQLKVQSQIQGEQLRVTGKNIDDLQKVITYLKDENLGIPIQFVNMKK